jgi:hypothetical protein
VVQRNCRRDTPLHGAQHGQPEWNERPLEPEWDM